jgi:hypothetical protein
MIHHRTLLFLLASSVVAACGPTNPPGGGSPDAAPDVAAEDASPDAAPDAAPDVTPPDVTTMDVARDTPAPDAAPDVAPDAAPDRAADAPTMDARLDAPPTCNGDAPSCVQGTAGGQCSDALTIARCEGTTWRCGAGEVLVSECRCLGRPPGPCTCGPTGWVCPDAAVDVPADLACTGRPASCVSGTAGGQCGDVVTAPMCVAGSWACPSGSVFITQCACVGRPPGRDCTCGSAGWMCPDAGTDAATDGGTAGTLCSRDTDCTGGLLCCYPCGIPGCMNRCTAPMGGRCPLIP